jgi:hypothetical protein
MLRFRVRVREGAPAPRNDECGAGKNIFSYLSLTEYL